MTTQIITEVALTPGVFDSKSYESEAMGDFCLASLKEILLGGSVVPDLRNGGWSRYLEMNECRWHRRAKELLKKLRKERRIFPYPPVREIEPSCDNEWTLEAGDSEIEYVIGNECEYQAHRERLKTITRARPPVWQSMQIPRNADAYVEALAPVLRHANSFMFIDPHMDPTEDRYRPIIQLLLKTRRTGCMPHLELHRVVYTGSGRNRRVWRRPEMEQQFTCWNKKLAEANLTAEVHVWGDFHNRYLITNLLGLSIPNGFDEGGNYPDDTWSKLSKDVAESIEEDFVPNAGRNGGHLYKFQLGDANHD